MVLHHGAGRRRRFQRLRPRLAATDAAREPTTIDRRAVDARPTAAGRAGAAPPSATGRAASTRRACARTLRQLAPRGIDAVSRSGRVHRDIKPSTCWCAPTAASSLLDFGLIDDRRRLPAVSRQAHSRHPAFMAPEQASGTTSGPEADWYAFGVMFYLALTGSIPFAGSPT